MIFKKKDSKYPIRGIPDNFNGVSYRTGPNGWMDKKVIVEYLSDSNNIRLFLNGRSRYMFCNNCRRHNELEDRNNKLLSLKTKFHFLPENSTYCTQPDHSFIVSKIKDEWRRMWEVEKKKMINDSLWNNKVISDGNWSSKLKNPGKTFFLNWHHRK